MIGAIIGDIVGSRFEFKNIKSKKFDFFDPECEFTDDSILTLCIAKAFLECKEDYSDLPQLCIKYFKEIGLQYPRAGYGMRFVSWLLHDDKEPYNSCGNGSAMRVSACAYVAKDLQEALELSDIVTQITHNHPEGMKGARATTEAIYMALHGSTKEEIEKLINDQYYPMDFTIDSIRDTYKFSELSQNSVPQALRAFFDSTSYEDTIRNAISIGGDSDTIACIAGGVAEAYYGIPKDIQEKGIEYLDEQLRKIYFDFKNKYIEHD